MKFNQLFPPTYDGNAYIEITHRCNYSCKHCYVGCPRNIEMSFEQIKHLNRIFKKYHFKKIFITGGEPLLVEHLGKSINLLAKNFKVVLITNATLVKEKFEEMKTWNFQGAYISYDGPTEKEYKALRNREGLEKAQEGIKLIKSLGKPVNAGIILTKLNIDKVEPLIKQLLELDVDKINMSLAQPFGRTLLNKDLIIDAKEYAEKYLPKLIELKQKYKKLHFETCLCFPESMKNKHNNLNLFEKYISGCAAGKKFIYIRPDGYVMPCGYITGDEEMLKSTGNIFKQSLKQVYKTKLFQFFMRRSWESLTGKCLSCDYSFVCKGGCPFRSHYLKGDLFAPDPWCMNEPQENKYKTIVGMDESNYKKEDKIASF